MDVVILLPVDPTKPDNNQGLVSSFCRFKRQQSACFVSLQVPFPVLQGEGVEYLGHADEAIIAISNYRLHIKFKDSVINVSASHGQLNAHRKFTSVQMAPVSV